MGGEAGGVRLSVGAAAVFGGDHKDDLFFFMDIVEKAPGPDAVSKGRRFPIFKPFDVGAEVRFVSEPGVDVFLKFFLHPTES